MVQMQLMRGLRAVIAFMIAFQLPLVEVDPTGNDSPERLRWEITPESIVFEAKEATPPQLECQLTVSSEDFNSSTVSENGGLMFSFGLSKGLTFATENDEAVKAVGNAIVMRDANGERTALHMEAPGYKVELAVEKGSADHVQVRAMLKPLTVDEEAQPAESPGTQEAGSDPTAQADPIAVKVTFFTNAIQAEDGFADGELTLTASLGEYTASTVTAISQSAEPEPQPEPGVNETKPERNDQEQPTWEIVNRTGFGCNVFWLDNHNEANARTSRADFATAMKQSVSFTFEGTTYPLNEETMGLIGLTRLPEVSISPNGVNAYTITYPANAFPTLLRDEKGNEYPVEWQVSKPGCDQYDAIEVNETNLHNYPSLVAQQEAAYGWYYLLKTSYHFHVILYSGSAYQTSGNLNEEAIKQAILSQFYIRMERPYHEPVDYLLKDVAADSLAFEVNTTEGLDDVPDEANKMATITISNSWKYNVNGERIGYQLVQKVEAGDEPGRLPAVVSGEVSEGSGDFYKITYDNSGTSYASQTDATYPDGKLYLTLSGEEVYRATKIWQDQGVIDAVRPDATLELWRYRSGQSFESATPVRDSKGAIVQLYLPSGSSESVVPIVFQADAATLLDSLPKYDAEGYRYIYAVKEYLSGQNIDKYQQVFGTIRETEPGSGKFVIEDTLPIIDGKQIERAANNYYVYNGGTLSNCVNVTVTTEGIKTWKAVAFQADFGNVIVELTLQYRPITEDDSGTWVNTIDLDGNVIKEVKYGFGEEELAWWKVKTTTPKYGGLGRRLEFRWAETGVYQPTDIDPHDKEALQAWYKTATVADNRLDLETGTFTLRQNGREIRYQSIMDVTSDHTPIIVNRLQNTIHYLVEKRWDDGLTPQPISFAIFRLADGETLTDQTPAYLSFTMDETGQVLFHDLPTGVTIQNPAGEAWKALLENLPEFDENGSAYQYTLMESRDGYWTPTYETTMEGDTIKTIVTNGAGEGQRIMTRKEWVDNSDIAHRDPVTVEVWRKGMDRPMATVVLNPTNDWSSLVGIADGSGNPVDLNEVYIKEVKAGEGEDTKEVNYENADWQHPQAVVGSYTSNHHNYEVSYTEKQDIMGESVFTVSNRRVNTVNLTVTKQWKDNDAAFREAIQNANKVLPEGRRVNPAFRLVFVGDTSEDKRIYDDARRRGWVDVGLDQPSEILNQNGNRVSSMQAISVNPKGPSTQIYTFYNLPKYDNKGAMVHYTVEEVWTYGYGQVIPDLDQYFQENLSYYPEGYTELRQLLREYDSTISNQSYTAGRLTERVAAPWSLTGQTSIIAPDEQTIEYTNHLRGTKSVYWHKLWDDDNAYGQGNRPDLYLDIFQVVHDVDANGKPIQVIKPYIRDYRWDRSNNADVEQDVLDKGNDTNHWHVVLDNLPKYDEATGREYFYYAIEQTKVNAKQFDYADAAYYFNPNPASGRGHASDPDDPWPPTLTEDMIPIGTAHGTVPEGFLAFDTVSPALAITVPDDLKVHKPFYPHYAYPAYMLLEDGYFHNSLKKDIFIDGQKLWSSLPNGYANTDLPAVQFSVYRAVDNGISELSEDIADMEFVATLTVKDWASIYENGTYRFVIDHITNAKGEPVDETGKVVDQVELAAKLPQYNEKGQIYRYTLVEDKIIWVDGTKTLVADTKDSRVGIFDTTQPGTKDYVASNAYVGNIGSLTVKKLLKLETKMHNGKREYVYPAVKFNLERYYYPNASYVDGQLTGNLVKDESFHQEKIWSSQEVQAAHTGSSEWVSGRLTFENLEQYAPNGSFYYYTVREDKEHMGGYATWVAKGDFEEATAVKQAGRRSDSMDNLIANPKGTPSDQAAVTFLNTYDRDNPEKYPLILQKVWRDYDNVFNLRPRTITASIYRYADAQPGQGNSIREDFATVTLPTAPKFLYQFMMRFEPGIQGYVLTGIQCLLTNTDVYVNREGTYEPGWQWTLKSFERYAPNGMPWKYAIKERDPGDVTTNPYRYNQGVVVGKWNSKEGKITDHTVAPLINSLYIDVPFTKQWQDEAGNPIVDDYLGKDLTSNFILEVREQDSDIWHAADKYFDRELDEKEKETIRNSSIEFANAWTKDFEKRITGRINAPIWQGAYQQLPTIIRKQDNTLVRLEYRVLEESFVYGGETNVTLTLNRDEKTYTVGQNGLLTSALFHADGNVSTNRIHTTSLTVSKIWANDSFNQYRTRPQSQEEGFSWETTLVVQRRSDDKQPWQDIKTVTLRGNDADTAQSITIAGLPTMDSNRKTYRYRTREVEPGQNTLVENNGDPYYNGTYIATYEESAGNLTAINRLRSGTDKTFANYAAEKNWAPTAPPDGEEPREAVFALQYRSGRTQDWETLTTVTLDGKPDRNLTEGEHQMAYGEDKPWHAIWKYVPQIYPGSYIPDQTSGTIYRVVEISHQPKSYLSMSHDVSTDSETCTFVFTNIQDTRFAVEKHWLRVDETEHTDVMVGLYRTTDAKQIGRADDALAVKVDDVPMTQTLQAPDWNAAFENLPAYDSEGQWYHYYALEQAIDGVAIGDGKIEPLYNFEPNRTTITNVPITSVNGTKTWLDDSNQDGKRPEQLTLILLRNKGATGQWETVDATPTWKHTDQNVWEYTFDHLPAVSADAYTYQYRVEEVVPEGYTQRTVNDDYTFINVRSGTTEMTVTKQWFGDETKELPHLHVTLYRSIIGVNGEDAQEIVEPMMTVVKDQMTWTYTFRDLPKYDENGILYTYWAEETVPEGYDAKTAIATDGGTLENHQQGALRITKQVDGKAGETERAFAFRVTLSGTAAAGIEAVDINGNYGDVAFEKGVAEFTLKHNEEKHITELPAGLTYTVTELDANQDGYVTSSVHATGTIPYDTVEVAFINRKNTPKTGDSSRSELWWIIGLLSLGALWLLMRKKNDDQK